MLDIQLGLLAGAAPDDRASAFVDFHHVAFGFFAGKSKDSAEDHGDIAHEVHRVVVNHNIPDGIEIGFVLGFDFGSVE